MKKTQIWKNLKTQLRKKFLNAEKFAIQRVKKEKREPDERVSFNNFHESGHQRDTNFGEEQMISNHISR